MPSSSPIGALFGSSNSAVLTKLDELYALQVHVTFEFEISMFLMNRAWRDATSVVDLGCGNGAFIEKIVRLFPDKYYLLVDKSSDMLDLARERFAGYPNVEFLHSDFENYRERADFFVCRAFLQHQCHPESVVKKIFRLLRNKGGCYFMSQAKRGPQFYPRSEVLDIFFTMINKERDLRLGPDSDLSSMIRNVAATSSRKLHVKERSWIIPSSLAKNLTTLDALFPILFDLYAMTTQYDESVIDAAREYQTWSKERFRYIEIYFDSMNISAT